MSLQTELADELTGRAAQAGDAERGIAISALARYVRYVPADHLELASLERAQAGGRLPMRNLSHALQGDLSNPPAWLRAFATSAEVFEPRAIFTLRRGRIDAQDLTAEDLHELSHRLSAGEPLDGPLGLRVGPFSHQV